MVIIGVPEGETSMNEMKMNEKAIIKEMKEDNLFKLKDSAFT